LKNLSSSSFKTTKIVYKNYFFIKDYTIPLRFQKKALKMKQTILLFSFTLMLMTYSGATNINKSKLLLLVNQARITSQTCGDIFYEATDILQWNEQLEQAAQNHSDDMNKQNFFSHISSNGSTLKERLNEVGYSLRYAGENIARKYPTEESVMKRWLKSPEHCKNIMNPNYTQMGVAKSGAYWTQVFAN
jgi:uncharacterized protein YkwD